MTCAQTRHMTAQLLCVPLPLSLVVVIEMKKVVPHKKGSSIGRVLRFLRMNRRVEQSSSYQEIAYVPTPTEAITVIRRNSKLLCWRQNAEKLKH